MQKINIFKAGKHTSASGQLLEFKESDLQATVNAYNPETHEAPIVVGHPKDNGPAYGWIQSLAFSEDSGLEADPQQVDPDFSEMVNAGRFKKVSASFYTPESPNNPVPGVFYLRHVGFLGAQPPAVKGLRDVSFSDSEEGIVEFGEWNDIQNASLWRKLREWMISQHSQEEADKVIPSYAVEELEAAARESEPEPIKKTNPIFSEENTMTQEELQAENERLQLQLAAEKQQNLDFSEREKVLADKEAELAKQESMKFIEDLVAAGKVLPTQKNGLTEFMQSLDEATVVEFGEGDHKFKKPQKDFFKSFLESLPVQVDFNEHSADSNGNTEPVEISPDQIVEKAQDYIEEQRQKGHTVTATQAVDYVTRP